MQTSHHLPHGHAPRWMPRCPDCGYAIRALSRPTCPECGVVFPTRNRYFRRWAALRIEWDRINRGSLVLSYIRTLAVVIACPRRACCGLVVPDRWGRCIRWAGAHISVSAIVTTLLANGGSLYGWFMFRLLPEESRLPYRADLGDIPLSRMVVWLLQSAVVWAFVFSVPVVVGALLAICIPRRHRASKLGGLKWTLYLTALFPFLIGAWYGYCYSNPPIVYASFPVEFSYSGPPRALSVALLGVAYGLWWATGIAANPYNRERGIFQVLRLAVAYTVAWVIVTKVLFPLGVMNALL